MRCPRMSPPKRPASQEASGNKQHRMQRRNEVVATDRHLARWIGRRPLRSSTSRPHCSAMLLVGKAFISFFFPAHRRFPRFAIQVSGQSSGGCVEQERPPPMPSTLACMAQSASAPLVRQGSLAPNVAVATVRLLGDTWGANGARQWQPLLIYLAHCRPTLDTKHLLPPYPSLVLSTRRSKCKIAWDERGP